jgi:hypothetical protein
METINSRTTKCRERFSQDGMDAFNNKTTNRREEKDEKKRRHEETYLDKVFYKFDIQHPFPTQCNFDLHSSEWDCYMSAAIFLHLVHM